MNVYTIRSARGRCPNHPQRAFTLVSLAAVISLLTILVAFLVPLLNRLRASQEASLCIANMKRIGQATMMYAHDYDQVMPQSTANIDGSWRTNFTMMVPANWSTVTDHPAVKASKFAWPNTVVPYGLHQNDFICQSMRTEKSKILRFTYLTSSVKPWSISYTFNGALSSYSLARVTNPTRTPLIWEGNGRVAILGGVIANPFLRCIQSDQECTYQNTAADPWNTNGGITDMRGVYGAIWTHGASNHWLFIDGHCEARNLGKSVITGKDASGFDTDKTLDPYCGYNSRGIPNFYYKDYEKNVGHTYVFNP